MSIGPIQIEQYVFSRLEIEAEFAHRPDTMAPNVTANITVTSGPLEGALGKHHVALEVSSLAPDQGTLPYKIALKAIGIFITDPTWKDIEQQLHINGASILYSAAREVVLLITGRGPWGSYSLPTVNFQQFRPVPAQETATGSPINTGPDIQQTP